jgi:hypothetical protein
MPRASLSHYLPQSAKLASVGRNVEMAERVAEINLEELVARIPASNRAGSAAA